MAANKTEIMKHLPEAIEPMETRPCLDPGHVGPSHLPATKEYFHQDKRRADGLSPVCKTCATRYRVERKQEALRAVQAREVRAMTACINSNKVVLVPHLTEMIEEFMLYLGGPRGYVRTLMADFDALKPGHPARISIGKLIARMIQKNTEMGGAEKPIEHMTQKELEQQLADQLNAIRGVTIDSKLIEEVEEESMVLEGTMSEDDL